MLPPTDYIHPNTLEQLKATSEKCDWCNKGCPDDPCGCRPKPDDDFVVAHADINVSLGQRRLIEATANMVVNVSGVQVRLHKGNIVFISSSERTTRIKSLWGTSTVYYNFKPYTVDDGFELTIGIDDCDSVARRRVTKTNDPMVTFAEFSIQSLWCDSQLFKHLAHSKRGTDERKVIDKIEKNAAIIQTVECSHGPYTTRKSLK
jgi:hypothetical protein